MREVHRPLVLARFLTRAGDHGWGLAVPLALMIAFPGTFRAIAAYYLVTRLAVVIAMPLIGRWIDESDRLGIVRVGIGLQLVGVTSAATLFSALGPQAPAWGLPALIASGVVAQVGATIMGVVLPGRWVPALCTGEGLSEINSRLKQSDLISEVASPVAAGSLMALASTAAAPYRGFHVVALANLVSFALEYSLLARVYRANPELALRTRPDAAPPGSAPLSSGAVRTFLAQPTLPVMLAYGLLWFTVLTPHGALLTSFLKSEWHLDERWLGLVRGIGALCGLAPTLFFARVRAALGTRVTAATCIAVQFAALVVACLALSAGTTGSATVFVVALMVSRFGLYGFVLAELQIFQERVPDAVRGRVGAAALAYDNALGLAVYAFALVVSDPASFPVLAWASCAAVGLGAALVFIWAVRTRGA